MESEVIWLIVLAITLLAGILSGIPVMLVIAGVPVLVAFAASLFGAFDLGFLHAYPQRIFGVMNNTILVAVPLFVLMGVLLERSRAAERMLLTMTALLGGSRTMLALSVLFVSTLIAASTGIIGATIVMLAMIALPALLGAGLSPRFSSGLICASGTLGQIIPPSIVLILLGDQISNAHIEAQRNIGNFAPDPVSVGDLFAGALLPGLMLVGLYAIYAVCATLFSRGSTVQSPQIPTSRAQLPTEDDRANLLAFFRDALPPLLLIIAVLGSILVGVATPTEAAAVGVCGTFLLTAASLPNTPRHVHMIISIIAAAAFAIVVLKWLGWTRVEMGSAGRRLSAGNLVAMLLAIIVLSGIAYSAVRLWRSGTLQQALTSTIHISAMIFGIIIAASMLSLVFRGFGGDVMVHEILMSVPGDKWGILIITMLVIFLLGFVLEFVEIIFIVIPIIGPVLLAADFHPVWFGILVALNLQTSFLTPPFGFALFYFRSVAPDSISTWTLYLSIIPFVIIQIIAIVLLVIFPGLAIWLPSVLFG
jgi:tripartite ATP-independent transporter DctM subunit